MLTRFFQSIRSSIFLRLVFLWVKRSRPSLDRHATLENLRILSEEYGHALSVDQRISVDRKLQPIPFYTYPAIDYIDRLPLRGLRVYEFGAGQSSLYFENRGCSVFAVDVSHDWREIVLEKSSGNIEIELVDPEDERAYSSSLLDVAGEFDIVVIDGTYRLACAESALKKLKPTGFIILDNAEWCPRTALKLSSAGLTEISFTGFGPVNGHTWTTSLFLGPECRPMPEHDPAPTGSARILLDGTFVDIDVNTPGIDRRIVPGHLDDPNLRRRFEWTFDTPADDAAWETNDGHAIEFIEDGYAGNRAARISESVAALNGPSAPTVGVSTLVGPEQCQYLTGQRIEVELFCRSDPKKPSRLAGITWATHPASTLRGDWQAFQPSQQLYTAQRMRFDLPDLPNNSSLRLLINGDGYGENSALLLSSVTLRIVSDDSHSA